MKNYNESVEISHNPYWPYIPSHIYKVLIIDGSRSCKTKVLLHLIKDKPSNLSKVYFCIQDPFESKY